MFDPQPKYRDTGWPCQVRDITSAVSPIRPAGLSSTDGVTFRAVMASSTACHTRGAGETTLPITTPSSARRL